MNYDIIPIGEHLMGTLTDCMITNFFSPKLDCYLDADHRWNSV